MPGGQAGGIGGLGLDALHKPHAGELSRADGQQGVVLLPALAPRVKIIPFPVLHHHPEAHNAVVCPVFGAGEDEMPQKHQPAHQGRPHPDEPPPAHPGHPGHDHKDEQVDDDHTPVARQHRQRPGEHPGQHQVFHQGGKAAQPPGPLLVNHPGQHHDIGQLCDLPGLEAGKAGYGQVDPALVPAVPPLAEGVDQGDDKQPQQQEHPPPFFHQKLNVDKGDPDVGHDTHAQEHGLPHSIAPEHLPVLGGGVDEHQPHQAGQDAQEQKNHVALFKKFPECARRLQGAAPSP